MPILVAQEMEKIPRRFMWGSSDLRRKIHYVKWSKITKPKKYGGLGIQGMVDKNLVLLAKWWWKLVSEVALAFREGLKLKLGNGNGISFWHDVWMGDKSIKDQYPKLYLLVVDNQASVREMGCWVGEVWYWQLKFRRVLYQWEEVNKSELKEGLKHIQLKDREDDIIVWSFSADGIFNTNSLMRAAMAIRINKNKWEQLPFQLWSGLTPPKVEMLIWRIYR
ncbi:hypothetical protein QQ045_022363 [Rhodiola kirilowii]